MHIPIITRAIQALGYGIRVSWLFCFSFLSRTTLVEQANIPTTTDLSTQLRLLTSHDLTSQQSPCSPLLLGHPGLNALLTLKLVSMCMMGQTKDVDTLIRNHGRKVDINLFLDTIAECSDTTALGFWSSQSKSIRAVLEGFSIWSETINKAFVRACEYRSPLTVGIAVRYRGSLTPEAVEAGLTMCHTSSPEICLRIFRHVGDDATRFHAGDKRLIFTPTSLAIGWSVSQRRVTAHESIHALTERYVGPILTETESYMHTVLDHHYRLLPGVPRSGEGRRSSCMMNTGRHGCIDMIRALIQVEPKLAGMFLKQASTHSQFEALTMIVREYRHALDHQGIEDALQTAVWSAMYESVDLLVELLGNDVSQDMYVSLFNTMCNFRIPKGLELLLNRFKQKIEIDNGFTFDPYYAKKNKEIVSLLNKAYGSKLVDQFPDWETE